VIVGAAAVEIHIHGSRSLKEKRGVVRSITQRVRNRFNLAVSEVGGHDRWQTALLGLAAVGHEEVPVRRVLDKAVAFIEELHLAEITNSDVEILRLPYEAADDELNDADDDEEEEPAG
jgi:uncharacterized protein YlxP (DUF503 family)